MDAQLHIANEPILKDIFCEPFPSSRNCDEEESVKEDTSISHFSKASTFNKLHDYRKILEPDSARDKLAICVTDTGIGIKKKDRINLFKLFGCLQNTRQMNS